MFCPHCGNQLPDGSRFCGKCGAQLGGPAAPAAGPATGPVVAGAPKKGLDPRVKLGIIVVAALAVVGAIVFGIVSCVRGGGHGSAQDVANGLNSAMTKMVDGDFSAESISGAMNDLIGLMPQKVVDQQLQEQGITREELSDQLESAMGVMNLEQVQSYMSMVDITISTSVGDPLTADDLSDINSELSAYGLTATEGNRLVMTMSMSALGQSQSQDVDTLCAVKIDGGWYLWGV